MNQFYVNISLYAQVSLNELEAERDQLTGRLAAADTEAVGLRAAADENAASQATIADLTRKNAFLFEEIARERLRLESKITTLAERCDAQTAETAGLTAALESVQSENGQLSSYKRQVSQAWRVQKGAEGLRGLWCRFRLHRPKKFTVDYIVSKDM